MEEKALSLARTMIDFLDEKKGEDILLLDLIGICSFTDYFVLCNGTSERMLSALADELQRKVRSEHQIRALSVEGDAKSGWILLDYGEVILHLFSPAIRDYYGLEDIWRSGRVLLSLR
jgi:ribosome-associated protein